jgi:hypothetical protein
MNSKKAVEAQLKISFGIDLLCAKVISHRADSKNWENDSSKAEININRYDKCSA